MYREGNSIEGPPLFTATELLLRAMHAWIVAETWLIVYFSGSGYVFYILPRQNKNQINKKLHTLNEEGWIDSLTRAVMVEASLYNPHANLFTFCTLLFEFTAMGNVVVAPHIYSLNLYRHSHHDSKPSGADIVSHATRLIARLAITFWKSLVGHLLHCIFYSETLNWISTSDKLTILIKLVSAAARSYPSQMLLP